mmetsp:Transcript_106254/g.195059  ORF Transcript_106254/g.195059 Transcript_106254/m.195059 type:complete len:82 (-) Transcript_106254:13-258(-)
MQIHGMNKYMLRSNIDERCKPVDPSSLICSSFPESLLAISGFLAGNTWNFFCLGQSTEVRRAADQFFTLHFFFRVPLSLHT